MSARAASMRAWWLGVTLSLASTGLASPVTRAQPTSMPAEVLIVLGSAEGTGSDPQLEKIAALRKPPFDSLPKKTLLQRSDVKLEPGAPSELDLPNGRKLRLSLVEKLKDGRLRVSVSINRPGQRDYLPLLTVAAAPGDPFFVAGQKHAGGTLIIGVRVGSRP